ncbi:hypothetical protein ABE83_34585 (plasmid) [Streptomyces sp. CFMR 7]|nr:hypothetical protein ABE83_34585 [Streptomyces sp. CFMR 7]
MGSVHAPAAVRDKVRAAAAAFEQAVRAPGARTLQGAARAHFKASARALEHAPRAARGGGAPALITLLTALVEAATAWHHAQHLQAQARSAAQAAVLLREAAALTTPARTTPPAPPPGPPRAPYG